MKLSKKQLTQAVTRYARRHGHYVRTVRTMTSLRLAAIEEWHRVKAINDWLKGE